MAVPRLEEVLAELGEAPSSPEDAVRPDSAELAAMEFDKIVVFSSSARRAA